MENHEKIFESLFLHWQKNETRKIADLFTADKTRFENFSVSFEDIFFDYSKTNISNETKDLLFDMLEKIDVAKHTKALFGGEKINTSENRAVSHMAYRAEGNSLHEKLFSFADEIRNKKFKNIVHIGIGGSHIGQEMAVKALAEFSNETNIYFLANIDSKLPKKLDIEKTLFIIASKTFTTIETMLIANKFSSHIKNFIAITANKQKAIEFGISEKNIFTIPESVGGRFSIWSAMGLPLLLAIGKNNFKKFLQGGQNIDEHFQTAEPKNNMPILQALVSIWHHTICQYASNVILPYDERLALLPNYLQQLTMESNGKHISKTSEMLNYKTAPIIWGGVGTASQHSFHQLLHQGTNIVPADFFICANSNKHLIANAVAQSQALMQGKDNGKNFENCAGNRPSVTFVYKNLTPYVLGQIIALFEYKVFIEGLLLNINSFDQYGVELGKTLAKDIMPRLESQTSSNEKNIIDKIKKMQ